MNYVDGDGRSLHREVMSWLDWRLDPGSTRREETKRFALEWFAAGVHWKPVRDDFRTVRKCLTRLSVVEAYELIQLFAAEDVIPAETLAQILDTPKLRAHLVDRHAAIVSRIPRLANWIK
ncbi:MAG: hypothetical protein KJ072_13155 [Verrucomicrobia bacterium]|nr:hypothetical protein [Verrucomicrobiota bacterium]